MRELGLLVLGLAATAGCVASDRPPAIRLGSECAACGMEIEDLRFACERNRGGWSQYDSIECLVRAGGKGALWLADYDSRRLAPAESTWIVRGEFASPMGGGLAAFATREAAERVASETRGRVLRLADLAQETAR